MSGLGDTDIVGHRVAEPALVGTRLVQLGRRHGTISSESAMARRAGSVAPTTRRIVGAR